MNRLPTEYTSIVPPAGCHRIIAGQAVLDLSTVPTIVDGVFSTPADHQVVLRYRSQRLVNDDLVGGAATQIIDLDDEPTGWIPIAAYIVTAAAISSGDAGTTGLTAEVGVSGDPDGYVTSHSIFGAASRKQGPAGVMINSFRSSDALQLKLTATGGSADIADILGLDLKVVVLYLAVSAES